MKQHSNAATTLVMQSMESKILAGVSKCQRKECQSEESSERQLMCDDNIRQVRKECKELEEVVEWLTCTENVGRRSVME